MVEPITSVVHLFAEHSMYDVMFSIAPLAAVITNTVSIGLTLGYMTWFDFMRPCNFEFIPSWAFNIFPPQEYIMKGNRTGSDFVSVLSELSRGA
jgi:hypothetical protein